MMSIVRNGNHFVNFNDDGGWILIDGPWYDRLSRIHPKHIFYLTKQWSPSPAIAIERSIIESKILKWEKVRWCPGFPYAGFRYKYDEFFKKFRYKVGWRVYPDGKLPILFNAIEWNNDMRIGYDERN